MIRKQRGFSLIELLVSVLIMSIGVLGMAGLQVLSLQQNRSALLQGEATLLVNDIMDRIRANPSTAYSGILVTDTPVSVTNCVGNTCSEAEMRAFDVAQWQCSINSLDSAGAQITACNDYGVTGSLPGGPCANLADACAAGSITLTGSIYAVSVQWVDQQRVNNSAGVTRSVTVSMRAP
jgi:type IV pilus assembly protein PilV